MIRNEVYYKEVQNLKNTIFSFDILSLRKNKVNKESDVIDNLLFLDLISRIKKWRVALKVEQKYYYAFFTVISEFLDDEININEFQRDIENIIDLNDPSYAFLLYMYLFYKINENQLPQLEKEIIGNPYENIIKLICRGGVFRMGIEPMVNSKSFLLSRLINENNDLFLPNRSDEFLYYLEKNISNTIQNVTNEELEEHYKLFLSNSLELTYKKLIEFKKQKNSPLVILKDNKIVKIIPE